MLFFSRGTIFFPSIVPLITIHSLSVMDLYILGCDVLSRGGNIGRAHYQSLGTGTVIFFFLFSACQMTPAVPEGGSGKGMKRKQWHVSEVTERVGELSERCKERRNPLEVW